MNQRSTTLLYTILTLALLATGAQGVISVASNVVPGAVAALCEAVVQGDLKGAQSLHHYLSPLYKACFVESNPIPVKAALSLLGLCSDMVRLPLAPASEATRKLLSSVLKGLKDCSQECRRCMKSAFLHWRKKFLL